MADFFYDKINDYGSVTISLASPDVIRSWSYGEVKKPETINYRTYRSEKDGLFCERIFGPEKDYECFCGKYKGIKYKGLVCDRCGVKVTTSKVRRKRMGHINLAAPVAHIWFFKSMPSRIGNLLAVKTNALERVIYFQDYIVTEVHNVDLPIKEKDMLTEDQYRQLKTRYGDDFEAGMGAESCRELLRKIDLEETAITLRRDLKETNSKQKKKDIIKRLKTVEMIRDSPNRPEWMILEVVPVIPPDLRPLVMLESGNFATSDLNDLYRRLINRNNRLKKLIHLNAPEVIIRNEKRMLQQSVDALFDNSRCRRPVMGTGNRPLKSLTDMIKGKQGRFRENLLGKRVDYSARSVIVVEPTLHLNQCGLPKKIALELYQPFIIRRLKELGYADTIKSAKKMLERKDEEVWDILEDVIYKHPVLLNRAPTLHRIGIQAFEPVLVEGNAIKIHPLVCTGFNADFDGDQMAVHLPLSLEAQVEAHTLMLSTNNIFSPAHGNPIIAPSQDIVLGCYYVTAVYQMPDFDPKKAPRFAGKLEALMAFEQGKVKKHDRVWVRFPEGAEVFTAPDKVDLNYWNPSSRPGDEIKQKSYLTTVGRLIFNDILPPGMPFYNYTLKKKDINTIIATCHKRLSRVETLALLDNLKEMGFHAATEGGLSISKGDIRIPKMKDAMIAATQKDVDRIIQACDEGALTVNERTSQVIDLWTKCREELGKEMMAELANDVRDENGAVSTYEAGGTHYLNPIYIMADSGARGSVEQIRQLAGMRGLMAKPSGKIIETPIKANFREGLRVLEYFSSTHGARKGLADTALKTADSGYLTRKLVDVAQNVVVNEFDCFTKNGVTKRIQNKGEKSEISLYESIRGRVARHDVKARDGRILVRENELITDQLAKEITDAGIEQMDVRSALTCESPLGVCALCYGADLSKGNIVELGMAVGIIAAQSIGEPGTQLTMRTFHIGGVALSAEKQDHIKCGQSGNVRFEDLRVVTNASGQAIALTKRGEVVITDDVGLELERHIVPLGSVVHVKEGKKVKKGTEICRWDAFTIPIISESAGRVRYNDLVEGKTFKTEREKGRKKMSKTVIEHKGDLHPELVIEDDKGNVQEFHPIPEKAVIEVDEGTRVQPGDLLAKTPREVAGSQDIVGGLPRVTELFEARKPKAPAIIAEISGRVELAEEKRRGKRTIIIKSDTGDEREHLIPQGQQLKVRAGEYVKSGEPLVEGPLVPHDILRISGAEALQNYLLNEVQKVYRSQNVTINDKHIEIIVGQMLRKMRVIDEGDAREFLPDQVVDRFTFQAVNDRVKDEGGKPASAEPLLLGITKASLNSESFISAASFQETTKVLTEAALAGKTDQLLGLKENVILGHIIPAGTGFKAYYQGRVDMRPDENEAAPPAKPAGKSGRGRRGQSH